MRVFNSKNGIKYYNFAHSLIKFWMVFLGMGILFFAYHYFYNDGKKMDLNKIKVKLEDSKNIQIEKLGYKDEGLVISNIFASLKTESDKLITLHNIRPETFLDLGPTFLFRIGDWGIVTLMISPNKDEYDDGVIFTNGIRLQFDEELLSYFKDKPIKTFDDIVQRTDEIEAYVLTLPELNTSEITEEFYKNHVVMKKAKFGFGKTQDHFVRWRFKTTSLGDKDRIYPEKDLSRPIFSKELFNKIREQNKR